MKKTWWVGLLGFAVTTVCTSHAGATPKIGAPALGAVTEDPDGHALALKSLAGKPILVVYEDRGSAGENAALKADLTRLAKVTDYSDRVSLVPVADVTAYDHWPVRGFARNSVRDQSRKLGVPIYCDWHGTFRDALSLRRGTSNVVLIGKGGQVLFASEGTLSLSQRQTLYGMLRDEVAKK